MIWEGYWEKLDKGRMHILPHAHIYVGDKTAYV